MQVSILSAACFRWIVENNILKPKKFASPSIRMVGWMSKRIRNTPYAGVLAILGGFILHLTLGTLYCFGNMNTYMTSYLRTHVPGQVRELLEKLLRVGDKFASFRNTNCIQMQSGFQPWLRWGKEGS